MVVTLVLLAALVWALNPRRPKFRPAAFDPVTDTCPPFKGDFLPTNLTDVPGLSLAGLSGATRNRVLLRLNMEPCTCGCKQSLAACRASNPSCPTSARDAQAVVQDEPANAGAARAHVPAGKP